MWVRIQDKTSLLEVCVIKSDTKPNIEGKYVVWMPINIQGGMFGMPSVTAVLGEYSTKEQALQVLDDIEERINEGCPFVYQMPEDRKAVKNLKVDNETVEYVLRYLLNAGFDIQHTGNKIIDNVINQINKEE